MNRIKLSLFLIAFSISLIFAACSSDADCPEGMYCEMIGDDWGSCRGTPDPTGSGTECVTGEDCPASCQDGIWET